MSPRDTRSPERRYKSVLYLDDVRVPLILGIDVVRNYTEFVAYLQTHEMPELISLDHDLDISHCPRFEDEWTWRRQGIPYETYTEKTGRECAQYIVDQGLDLQQWAVHSQNPIGGGNIRRILQRYCPWGEMPSLHIPTICDWSSVYGGKVVDGWRVKK